MEEFLVLSGASGVGKGYLGKHLSKYYKCERLMATTTRAKRPIEVDGIDSHFLSEAEFASLQQAGGMFMCNKFFNAWYGFECAKLKKIYERGNVPVVEIYTSIIQLLVQNFPNSRTIFLMPESLDLLRQRMNERKQDEESLQYRLLKAQEEMDYYLAEGKAYYQYYYTVTNQNFASIVSDIVEKCCLSPRDSLPAS